MPFTAQDVIDLKAGNAHRWFAMKVSPGLIAHIDAVVRRAWLNPSFKSSYARIAAITSVPAVFVMLAHYRESDCAWDRSLAQGDRLSHRSVNVPAGRIPPPAQPPFTFEAAAIDALVTVDHVDKWTDWSIGGLLTKLEMWNGIGYALRHLPSAYVWAGTDQYRSGKFTSDGHFDPSAHDEQIGVAAVLARMIALDPDLHIAGLDQHPEDHPVSAPNPTRAPPADHQTTEWLQVTLNKIAAIDQYGREIQAEVHAAGGTFPLVPDGDYGRSTKAAVRGFQIAHGGLNPDGIAGPVTRRELEKVLAQ